MGQDGPYASSPHLVSIGYESRDVDNLIRSLSAGNVQVLVDVRLNPISRKRGSSKTALRDALAAAGIGYLHLRKLGNPSDNRDAYRCGAEDAYRRFGNVLESDEGNRGPAARLRTPRRRRGRAPVLRA